MAALQAERAAIFRAEQKAKKREELQAEKQARLEREEQAKLRSYAYVFFILYYVWSCVLILHCVDH